MGVTAAGITGGNPASTDPATKNITERTYGIHGTIMDVKAGNSADAWSAYMAFDWPTLYVLAECWSFNLDIQLSTDGGATYEDAKEIIIGDATPISFTATGFRHRNHAGGSTARYQVTGIGTGF